MKRKKRIGVIGHFGNKENKSDGQTIKTRIVFDELKKIFGNVVQQYDTEGGIRAILKVFFRVLLCSLKCDVIIILPGIRGIQLIVPEVTFIGKLFRRKTYYVVIGGWLPEFTKRHRVVKKCLRKIDKIYVETEGMKNKLSCENITNVSILRNFKRLKTISCSSYLYKSEFLSVCTFSRVRRDKGIELAYRAVRKINEKYNKTVFKLDIYGYIDKDQVLWFQELSSEFPDYVTYKGVIPFNKTVDILYKYYALLFPTYYEGEGFPGTVIDAYSAGVPILASNWKYNSEIIKDGYTGFLFNPNSIDDLIYKLEYIYSHRNEWVGMRENCLFEAKQYLPENAMKELISILENDISLM